MQRFVIIFALLACSLAAPLEDSNETSKPEGLTRPSPINPDIPSDPKPEEKITLITDPKVVPLNATEPTPGPLVVSKQSVLRTKREPKDSSESDESSSEEDKKPSRPLAVPPTSSSPKYPTPVPSTSSRPNVGAAIASPAHPKLPYSPTIHQHNEHLFKPATESHSTSTSTSTPKNHGNDKRDIPVPLTRKLHNNDDDDQDEPKHKEEPSSTSPSPSTKLPTEATKQEEKNDAAVADHDKHPAATFARPIPVAELFAKKPSIE